MSGIYTGVLDIISFFGGSKMSKILRFEGSLGDLEGIHYCSYISDFFDFDGIHSYITSQEL